MVSTLRNSRLLMVLMMMALIAFAGCGDDDDPTDPTNPGGVVTGDDGSEAIAIHSVGLLGMSWDHRAFDGGYAAAFLAEVRHHLESRDWEAEL